MKIIKRPTTNQQRADIIRRAIRKHLRAGGRLTYGTFGTSRSKKCCPITCVQKLQPQNKSEFSADSILNAPHEWTWSFIRGFDRVGVTSDEAYPGAACLGRAIRREFLPGT